MAEGARSLTGGRPSLLQDVLRGRRTEIEELNGFVVKRGRELGVPTPMNAAVVREVNRHAVGQLRPDPQQPRPAGGAAAGRVWRREVKPWR